MLLKEVFASVDPNITVGVHNIENISTNMASLLQVILFSLLGGVFSLLGGVLLLRNRKSARMLATYATPFAGGALLAAVFLDLLKEGISHNNPDNVLIAAMLGIVLFF